MFLQINTINHTALTYILFLIMDYVIGIKI